jgi:dynein heavy chain 1
MDSERALRRPILYSDFIKKDYVSVSQDELKNYIEGRLRTFYEEELNVQLVVFDSVIDHILRIDRVLK